MSGSRIRLNSLNRDVDGRDVEAVADGVPEEVRRSSINPLHHATKKRTAAPAALPVYSVAGHAPRPQWWRRKSAVAIATLAVAVVVLAGVLIAYPPGSKSTASGSSSDAAQAAALQQELQQEEQVVNGLVATHPDLSTMGISLPSSGAQFDSPAPNVVSITSPSASVLGSVPATAHVTVSYDCGVQSVVATFVPHNNTMAALPTGTLPDEVIAAAVPGAGVQVVYTSHNTTSATGGVSGAVVTAYMHPHLYEPMRTLFNTSQEADASATRRLSVSDDIDSWYAKLKLLVVKELSHPMTKVFHLPPMHLGAGGITLVANASVTIAEDHTATVQGNATVDFGNGQPPVDASVTGTLTNTSFSLKAAEVGTWALTPDLSLDAASVGVSLETSNETVQHSSATLSATLGIGSSQVAFATGIPVTAPSILIKSVRISPDLMLNDLEVDLATSTVVANASVDAGLSVPDAAPLTFVVTGTKTPTGWTLDGAVTHWDVDIGADGSTIAADVHLVATRGSPMTGTLTGTLTGPGVTASVSAAVPAPSGKGFTMTLTTTFASIHDVVDALVPSAAASAVPPSTMGHLSTVAPVTITVTTVPPTVTIHGSGPAFGSDSVDVVAKAWRASPSVQWQAGFAAHMSTPFSLADVTATAETSWHGLKFVGGAIVASTGGAPMTAPLYSTSGAVLETVSATDGVSVAALWAFGPVAAQLSEAPPSASPLIVTSQFQATTSDLSAAANLPRLPLDADSRVVLANATVSFDVNPTSCMVHVAGGIAVDGLTASLGGTVSSCTAASNASHPEPAAWTLTGTVDTWSFSDTVELESASVVLHRDTSVHGTVSANLRIADATVGTTVNFPDADGGDSFDANIPTLSLGHGVVLHNVSVDLSATLKTISATAVIGYAHAPLTIAVSGTLSGGDYDLSGSLANWEPSPGLSFTEVAVTLHGTEAGPSQAATLSGTVSAVAHIWGASVAVDIDLPNPPAKPSLSLTLTNVVLSSEVTLVGVHLEVTATNVVVGTTASIATHVRPERLVVILNGTHNATATTASGSLSTWPIASGWALNDVVVDLVRVSGSTSVTAFANMVIAGVTLDAEVHVPSVYVGISVPDLRLSPAVLLTGVELVDAGNDVFSLSAAASMTPWHNAVRLNMTVSGTVAHQSVNVTGSAVTLNLPAGAAGLHLRDAQVDVAWRPHSVVATIAADVTWATATATALIDVSGSNVDAKVTFSDPVPVGDAVAAAVGSSSAVSALDGPSTTKSSLSGAHLTAAVLTLDATGDDLSLTLTARTLFGSSPADASFAAVKAGSQWEFAVGVAFDTPPSFAALFGASAFSHMPFTEAGLTFASAADIPMPPLPALAHIPASMLTAQKAGTQFVCWVELSALSHHLDALGRWTSAEGVVAVGAMPSAPADASFTAHMPPNLPLGSMVTLNATVVIQQPDPQFALSGIAKVTFGDDDALPPGYFQSQVAVDTDGAFTVTGWAHEVPFRVGHHGMATTNVTLNVTDSGPAASSSGDAHVTGFLTGGLTVAGIKLGMLVEFPPADESHGLTFDFTYDKATNIVVKPDGSATAPVADLTSFLDAFTGPSTGVQSVTLPSDFQDIFSATIGTELTLSLTTVPLELSVSATLHLFHMEDALEVQVAVGQDEGQGNWAFSAGINLSEEFKISEVLPSTGKVADGVAFASGMVVVSTFEDRKTFTLNGESIVVEDSVALVGYFTLDQGSTAVITKWTGISALTVLASFELESKAFRLAATIDTDWSIGSKVQVTNASLFMDVGPPRDFDIGVSVDLVAQVGSRPEDTLGFEGAIMFSDDSVVFRAQTLNPWVSPFGIRGVTVGDTEIELGIAVTGEPDLFGFSGSLIVGSESGSLTVYVDALHPEDTVLAASLSSWNLGHMVEHLTDNAVPAALADTVLDVGFTDLKFEFNGGEAPLHFNQQTFLPGFYVHVGSFVVFDFIKGSATVAVSEKHGLFVNATIDPIHVGPDGDILSLSGFDSTTAPAQLLIDLGFQSTVSSATSAAAGVATGVASLHQNALFASVSAHFLNVLKLDAYVLVQDSGWNVNATYTDGIMKIILQSKFQKAAGGKNIPTDFDLYAEVDLELLDFLGTTVVGYLKEARSHIDSGISGAEQKLSDWNAHEKPKLDANKAKIAEYQHDDTASFDAAESKLRNAQGSLANAESKVNNLQNEIKSIEAGEHHCHHIDPKCWAHDAWAKAKVAGLWTAEKAADGALDVAKAAVGVANDAVKAAGKVTPDADPRVLALETANGAIEAAYSVAEEGLKAADAVADAATELAEYPLELLAKGFNVEKVWISAGSLNGVKSSGKVGIGAQGVLLGKSFNYDLEIPFPPKVADIVSNVWTKVKSELHL